MPTILVTAMTTNKSLYPKISGSQLNGNSSNAAHNSNAAPNSNPAIDTKSRFLLGTHKLKYVV